MAGEKRSATLQSQMTIIRNRIKRRIQRRFSNHLDCFHQVKSALDGKFDVDVGAGHFSGRKRAFQLTQAEIDRYPPVRHPIVRTHPFTGRKCLYVMRDDCVGIEGVDAEEAEARIAALAEHIVKPAFINRHQWGRGDLLMRDNCSVEHRAIQDYNLPQRRLMHRTTLGGAVPR